MTREVIDAVRLDAQSLPSDDAEDNPMSDLTETIDLYLSAWNETDATRRAAIVARVWTEDGRLVDPPMEAQGHPGISDLHAALQGQFPAHSFRRSSAVDAHHDAVRFSWELVSDADGSVVLTGLDVGLLAGDGRLMRITGFFGDLPLAG